MPQRSTFAEPTAVAATKAMIAKLIFEEVEEEEEEEVGVVAVQREGKHERQKFCEEDNGLNTVSEVRSSGFERVETG